MTRNSAIVARKEEPARTPQPEMAQVPGLNPVRAARLLLAEDDAELRRMLASVFRKDGHEVLEAKDGHELIETFADSVRDTDPSPSFDLIISDIRLPGLTGLRVLAELRALRCAPPVILITAFGDEETHKVARFLGAAAMLDKPFDIDDLRLEVARALKWT